MSPYLLSLLLPCSGNAAWGVPSRFTTADLQRQILADERYPTHRLPERIAAERRMYWESVRADDAAEYASEVRAAAEYTF